MEDGKKQALIAAATAEFAKVKAMKPWLGFSLLAPKSSDEPVKTKDVAPNSPASVAGLVNGESLLTAKGVSITAIPVFIKTITGMQVGDKIPLELADSYNTKRSTTLIVGTQTANTGLVCALVRIVVDGTVQDSDYDILQLKSAVDDYLRKNDSKSSVAAASSPEAPRPTLKGKACAFGYKPHQYKKDTCSVCGQPEAAHGGGAGLSSPPPREDDTAKRQKEEEERRQREAAEEQRKKKEREEAEEQRKRKEQEEAEEQRKRKEREEAEEQRKRKEKEEADEQRKRKEKEEAEATARKKRDEEESLRKKKEEEELKAKASVAAAAVTSSSSSQPKPTAGPRKSTKCPFGYKPHPVKKGTCSVCGRTEAAHAEDFTPVTTSSPAPSPVINKDKEQERQKQEEREREAREEQARLDKERAEQEELAELERQINAELERKSQLEKEERELEEKKRKDKEKEEEQQRKKLKEQQEREAAAERAATERAQKEKEREAAKTATTVSSSSTSVSSGGSNGGSSGGDEVCSNFEPVHPLLFKRKCKNCSQDVDLHSGGGGGGSAAKPTTTASAYDTNKDKEKEREREREKEREREREREKAEKEKREREERERREKAEREKAEREKAEREKAEKAKREREERERQERLARERSQASSYSTPPASKPSSAASSRRGSGSNQGFGSSTLSSDGKRMILRLRKKPYGPTEACGFFEPVHQEWFGSFCRNCQEHFTQHNRRGINIEDEFEYVPAEWTDGYWKPTKSLGARALSESEKRAFLETDKEKDKAQVAKVQEKKEKEKESRDAVEARVASLKEPPKSQACGSFEPVHPQFFAKKCKNCSEDISAHGASTEESSQPRSRRGSKDKLQALQNWEKHSDAPAEEPKEKPAPASAGKLKMLGLWQDKVGGGGSDEPAPTTKKEEEGDSALKSLRAGGAGPTGNLKAQWEAASTGTSTPEVEKPKASGGGKFVVNTPLCNICNKACYPQESTTYEKKLYHKTCFKCLQCKNQVSISGVAMMQGKLYCKNCFTRIFKTRGSYGDL